MLHSITAVLQTPVFSCSSYFSYTICQNEVGSRDDARSFLYPRHVFFVLLATIIDIKATLKTYGINLACVQDVSLTHGCDL